MKRSIKVNKQLVQEMKFQRPWFQNRFWMDEYKCTLMKGKCVKLKELSHFHQAVTKVNFGSHDDFLTEVSRGESDG